MNLSQSVGGPQAGRPGPRARESARASPWLRAAITSRPAGSARPRTFRWKRVCGSGGPGGRLGPAGQRSWGGGCLARAAAAARAGGWLTGPTASESLRLRRPDGGPVVAAQFCRIRITPSASGGWGHHESSVMAGPGRIAGDWTRDTGTAAAAGPGAVTRHGDSGLSHPSH